MRVLLRLASDGTICFTTCSTQSRTTRHRPRVRGPPSSLRPSVYRRRVSFWVKEIRPSSTTDCCAAGAHSPSPSAVSLRRGQRGRPTPTGSLTVSQSRVPTVLLGFLSASRSLSLSHSFLSVTFEKRKKKGKRKLQSVLNHRRAQPVCACDARFRLRRIYIQGLCTHSRFFMASLLHCK